MEYVYAAMLLHSAKKEISEDSVAGVLKAAHVEADSSRVKALVASLKEVNIDEAISKAAVAVAAPAQAAAPADAASAHKKEEKKEEQKSIEEAAEGLAGLFG
ncbi:MAG: 50S ribosomal protein P1 [Candidatus Diapherotrites archaeon]|nr:50S ribosomal protein P1 [Candidatus Diapherotrites archaeon]